MKKGITLIEALFVLGIMAIIIGIVMVLFSQSTTRTKSNQMAEEIIEIANSVNEMRNSLSPLQMTTINEKTIAGSGILPAKYIKNGLIVDPFGVSIQVFTDATSVAINMNDVNATACNTIASYNYGSALRALIIGDSGVLSPQQATLATTTHWCHYGNTFLEVNLYE